MDTKPPAPHLLPVREWRAGASASSPLYNVHHVHWDDLDAARHAAHARLLHLFSQDEETKHWVEGTHVRLRLDDVATLSESQHAALDDFLAIETEMARRMGQLLANKLPVALPKHPDVIPVVYFADSGLHIGQGMVQGLRAAGLDAQLVSTTALHTPEMLRALMRSPALVVCDDIIDSGHTMGTFMEQLAQARNHSAFYGKVPLPVHIYAPALLAAEPEKHDGPLCIAEQNALATWHSGNAENRHYINTQRLNPHYYVSTGKQQADPFDRGTAMHMVKSAQAETLQWQTYLEKRAKQPPEAGQFLPF